VTKRISSDASAATPACALNDRSTSSTSALSVGDRDVGRIAHDMGRRRRSADAELAEFDRRDDANGLIARCSTRGFRSRHRSSAFLARVLEKAAIGLMLRKKVVRKFVNW
jgi:hypothetical protein